jgi:hypothetical protein
MVRCSPVRAGPAFALRSGGFVTGAALASGASNL